MFKIFKLHSVQHSPKTAQTDVLGKKKNKYPVVTQYKLCEGEVGIRLLKCIYMIRIGLRLSIKSVKSQCTNAKGLE